MAANIIDRRLNPPGKSIINRQKFLKRAKQQIKETIQNSIGSKEMKDIGNNEKVTIKRKDTSEPSFRQNPNSGDRQRVLPGNKEYSVGDKIDKPKGGSGKGGSGEKNEGDPDGPDIIEEFEFHLTRQEFIEYLFEDLELPDFIKENIEGANQFKPGREGYSNSGSPANLNIPQTFKKSIGRKIALNRPSNDDIADLRNKIEAEEKKGKNPTDLYVLLDELLKKQKTIPFIEENDLKYNFWTAKPQPINKAVMFCLMDVSGSMGEKEKDVSKRFFLLLYLFLERKYDSIDLRFIRHTTTAEEVDEKTFFYDKVSGGTKISAGLEVIEQIIEKDYPVDKWNIYVAQCTDGDNTTQDNMIVEKMLTESILPAVQYYAYIQISNYHHDSHAAAMGYGYSYSAWPVYKKLDDQYKKMVCRQVEDKNKIWPIFQELFSNG